MTGEGEDQAKLYEIWLGFDKQLNHFRLGGVRTGDQAKMHWFELDFD